MKRVLAVALVLGVGLLLMLRLRRAETAEPQAEGETVASKMMATPSLESVRQSYLHAKEEKKSLAEHGETSECIVERPIRLPCVRIGDSGVSEFLYPVPVAFTSTGEINLGTAGDEGNFSWAPKASVFEGDKALAPILKSIQSRESIACWLDQCKVGVKATQGDEQRLAICDARDVNGTLGPPTDCEVIAVQKGAEWWMKVIDRSIPLGFPKMASVYKVDVEGLPRPAILAVIDRALADAPLSLSNRTVKDEQIMADSPKRHSKVLAGGWFEWPQVMVEIDSGFHVEVSLDLLVNKQNTSDPADWHMPTDQQEEQYRSAIESTVAKALGNICVGPSWSGTGKLTCASMKKFNGIPVEVPTDDDDEPGHPRKVSLGHPALKTHP
jgi:hypothetical protein